MAYKCIFARIPINKAEVTSLEPQRRNHNRKSNLFMTNRTTVIESRIDNYHSLCPLPLHPPKERKGREDHHHHPTKKRMKERKSMEIIAMEVAEDVFQAPPPTPTIATGMGKTTAAINDGDLTKYLESSLKIPDLTLPEPFPCSIKLLHRKIPGGIDLKSLRSGDETTVRKLMVAAKGTGAFRIDGHGLAAEEVRAVVELVAGRNRGGEEQEEEVEKWIGREEQGVSEELCWSGPVRGKEDELAAAEGLGTAPVTETYRVLRERLERLSMKFESIAETITKVIATQVKNPSRIKKMANAEGYHLLLKKHDPHQICNSPFDDCNGPSDYPSHSLSLHMSLESHEFRLRWKDSVTSYGVPAGSLVVTVGKQLQEWSNEELKGVTGEPVFDPHHDPNPSFSLEFMCSPSIQHNNKPMAIQAKKKSISVVDQVLIVLVFVLAFVLSFWAFDFLNTSKA